MFLNLYTLIAAAKFPSVRYTIKLIFTIVSSFFFVNCRPAEPELSIQTRYKAFLSIKTFPICFKFNHFDYNTRKRICMYTVKLSLKGLDPLGQR